uniref:Uncharacterized protein n=1 Tax=viral metagenome TaxID=1070528 RepID=A0A6M3ISQ1_9ZZZZ
MTKIATINESGIVSNQIEVDLEKVESDDPIAYVMGMFYGKNHVYMTGESIDLAPEFLRGYFDEINKGNKP